MPGSFLEGIPRAAIDYLSGDEGKDKVRNMLPKER